MAVSVKAWRIEHIKTSIVNTRGVHGIPLKRVRDDNVTICLALCSAAHLQH